MSYGIIFDKSFEINEFLECVSLLFEKIRTGTYVHHNLVILPMVGCFSIPNSYGQLNTLRIHQVFFASQFSSLIFLTSSLNDR